MILSTLFALSFSYYISLCPLISPIYYLGRLSDSNLVAATLATLFMSVDWWYLDWQVSSVALILNSPSEEYSAMEHLTLEHWNNMWSVDVYMEIEYK